MAEAIADRLPSAAWSATAPELRRAWVIVRFKQIGYEAEPDSGDWSETWRPTVVEMIGYLDQRITGSWGLEHFRDMGGWYVYEAGVEEYPGHGDTPADALWSAVCTLLSATEATA